MKLPKIGTKVRMTLRNAKWYLDHPEIYVVPYRGTFDKNFDRDNCLHLTCALGEPVYGIVDNVNENYVHVQWKVGKFKASYWTERYNYRIVRK